MNILKQEIRRKEINVQNDKNQKILEVVVVVNV